MARKKTTKKQQFIDGKNSVEDKMQQAKDIEEILGMRKSTVFSQASLEELENDLGNMSLSDLQELAVKAEVFPSGTRAALKAKLAKKYRSVTTGGESHTLPFSGPVVDPNSKAGKDAIEFLKEM